MPEGGGLFPSSCIFGFFGQDADDGDGFPMAGGGWGQNRAVAEEPVEAEDVAEAEERKVESVAPVDGGCHSGGGISPAYACGEKL